MEAWNNVHNRQLFVQMCKDPATYERVMGNLAIDRPSLFEAIQQDPQAFMKLIVEVNNNPQAAAAY